MLARSCKKGKTRGGSVPVRTVIVNSQHEPTSLPGQPSCYYIIPLAYHAAFNTKRDIIFQYPIYLKPETTRHIMK